MGSVPSRLELRTRNTNWEGCLGLASSRGTLVMRGMVGRTTTIAPSGTTTTPTTPGRATTWSWECAGPMRGLGRSPTYGTTSPSPPPPAQPATGLPWRPTGTTLGEQHAEFLTTWVSPGG